MKRFTLAGLLAMSVLIIPRPSHGEIVFTVENPGAQKPVSGISIISGWAFSTQGKAIQVDVFIDSQYYDTAPCCSSRKDVGSAYPQYPASSQSGWGLLLNWNNLSAGEHSLQIKIRAQGENLATSEERRFEVSKISASSVVEVTVSSAQAHVDGNSIMLEGVGVKDTTTNVVQWQQVRLRWNQGTQSFMLASRDNAGFTSFPSEVQAILERLLVALGLYLHYEPDLNHFGYIGQGCPGGRSPANYDAKYPRVELYSNWHECFGGTYDEMIIWVTHEVCHSHQHWAIMDAGLALSADPYNQLGPFLQTPEGRAFMAAGGRSNVPSNPSSGNPIEDNANVCMSWYLHRQDLKVYDPAMYSFAASWLPE